MLDNRELTPPAMLVSVYQSLQGTNVSAAEMSYRVKGELTRRGSRRCGLRGLMAQNELNSGAINAALYVGERFNQVYSNALEQPEVTGLQLKMEAIPERRTAVLEAARLSTDGGAGGRDDRGGGDAASVPGGGAGGAVAGEAAGGSDAGAAAGCGERWRDGGPADDAAGRRPLQQCGSDGAGGCGGADEPDARERCGVCDAAGSRGAGGAGCRVRCGGAASMANVLGPLKDAQKMQLTGESVVEVGSMETEYAVSWLAGADSDRSLRLMLSRYDD